ncbi:hypothetical protein IV203_038590 [Nitzschia inconspicua]|uniref:Exonuclease domain-containing protein n=1 Tax=Nitzschia inconspicua TaxID=303405 RepID=A0A9K3LNW0_9STRA|nr:hypothetical protein IV203_038590 [Nitzschia inconspicua]
MFISQPAFHQTPTTWNMSEKPPKRRKCGACKGAGHDRRNCPALRATKANNLAIPAVENRNGVDGGPSRLPIGTTMREITPNINWDKVCYALFDLETTGVSRIKDDIIELAAMVGSGWHRHQLSPSQIKHSIPDPS